MRRQMKTQSGWLQASPTSKGAAPSEGPQGSSEQRLRWMAPASESGATTHCLPVQRWGLLSGSTIERGVEARYGSRMYVDDPGNFGLKVAVAIGSLVIAVTILQLLGLIPMVD